MTRVDIEKFRGSFEKFKAKYGDCVITCYGVVAAVTAMMRPKRRSNNWLKMHGYPMRRKKRRRKRS